MDVCRSTKKSHKEWRKVAKKERRKRIRRKAAIERETDETRLRAALEKSADYLKWLEQCETEEKDKEKRDKEEHDEQERLWLEEEVRAQKEWQILQERKQKARELQLEQETKIRQEFEAKQETIRKKQDEEKRKREEDIRKREQLLKEIDDYIDNGIKTPEMLREIIDSQPGKELCPFFTKTGACRYGDTCSRNHRRVCLSKVILVPGFYTHFSLEKNIAEYDTDVGLEFESSETRQHFREFYKDVVPELESFGRIKTLKYCCNTEVHLRGNLYVEYYTEREAARALRRLKGRWYAGRQLNCEFVNLRSWRSAVCGMTKCPKGRACNFLHTFKNPRDEYDIKSPPRWTKQFFSSSQETIGSSRRSEHRSRSKWEEESVDVDEGKNWRWSESPEPELDHRSRNLENRYRYTDTRDPRQKSRDKRSEHSDHIRNIDNDETSAKRRRSSLSKHFDEKVKEEDIANGRDRFPRHSKSYQKSKSGEIDSYESKSKHSSKKHSRTSHKDHRSKHRRSSSKKISHKRRRDREESVEDSSKRNTESFEARLRVIKSKWDNENSEQADSDSSKSSDSEFSCTVMEEKKILERRDASSSRDVRRRRGISDDEWATTDSDSDTPPVKGNR